ncbi:methionine synthase [Halovivax sp.]|uniref:methionine synthase n=1 Tax=Halovivax sp. TaxID=1935978 RepID=UPI0025C16BA9|nr:methionine synthase [Halovivax sp.]
MSDETLIQTTHVGSLPRSEAVRDALRSDDEPGSRAFDDAVGRAVRDVVRKQADVGVDVANDGEQPRLAYSVDVTNRLSGYADRFAERALPADLAEFPEFAERALGDIENIGGPIATGPIEYVGADELEAELARFDEAVEAEGISFADRFHTAPSPGAVVRFTESEYHDDVESYLFDLAEALRTEYATIADHGALLQVDAPELLAGFTLTDEDASIEEFRERVETYVEAINVALDGVPADRVRLHACWGNYPGPHHHDVALGDVVDEIYEADAGGLVIEGANPRHAHEYRTIAEHPLPGDWTLVPGVIDVKTNAVEHPTVVADRLERFAESVGDPSRIVAGCDCGFETVMSANLVHPPFVWKKLEALVEGAKIASERLA